MSAYHKVTQTLNHFEQSSPQLRLFSHLDQVTLRANAYLNNEFDELTFGVFFISLCSQPLPIIKWSIVLKFSLGLFWQNIQWNTQNESFSSRQSSHSGWIYSLLKNRSVCIMWLIDLTKIVLNFFRFLVGGILDVFSLH